VSKPTLTSELTRTTRAFTDNQLRWGFAQKEEENWSQYTNICLFIWW